MVQSPAGEMWFLTEEGISIYDGLYWRKVIDSLGMFPRRGYRTKTLPDSTIYLFGTGKAGFTLFSYKNNVWSEWELPPVFDTVRQPEMFEVDNDPSSASFGQLCLTYQHKLYLFDGGWRSIALFPPESVNRVQKVKLRNDSILIATGTGLLLYRNETLDTLYGQEEILDFALHDGDVYLLGESWLGKLHDGQLLKYFDDEQIGLPNGIQTTNLYVRRNRIYYSYNSPLYSYDIRTRKRHTIVARSFGDNYTCMRALFDHENSLWIATLRGAFKISNIDVYSYNQTQLIEGEVTAILEAENGDLYLGSNSGFSILHKNGKIDRYPFPDSIIQTRVMDMVEYANAIYMAVNTAGFVRFANGTLSYSRPEAEDTRALDLQIYNGNLYGSSGGNVYQLTGNAWQLIEALTPTNSWFPMIRKIHFTAADQYLLTPVGIYDGLRKKYLPAKNPDLGNAYSVISQNGILRFGTIAGLAEIQNDTLVEADAALDPVRQRIYAMLMDEQARLWMGGDQGIHHVNPDGTITRLSKSNGLIGNEINRNALIQLQDGRLMIGTDQGVSVYEPQRAIAFPVPSVELTGIFANNKPVDNLQLAHDQNQLRFDFRSISYYDETLVNYRYRLAGFENDWQFLPYSTQRSVTYNNMKPGRYHFVVQGRVGSGQWSEEKGSGQFQILPAYYNTTWFQAIFGLILAVLVFLLVRFRNRQLKRTNQLLQDGIREKTEELHLQNNELVRTITELKTAQGQLIQSEKLASMGQLTAGIAHEMNNPLNYIRGGAECLRQNLSEINDLHNKIMAGGERKGVLKLKAEYEYLLTESRQLLESILNGAEKSTSIVKSLSSFTADSQSFYSFIELDREVETALTLLNNQIGFRIHVNKFYGNTPRIECYPAKIHQLLVNLLLNAIQAIRDEGEINIRIYRKDEKHIGLEISDTGEGIDEENQDKIFEPFYTTKDNNPGLGLTIARAIIQDHNGQITVRSKKNKGSRITIILPLQQTFHPELDPELSVN